MDKDGQEGMAEFLTLGREAETESEITEIVYESEELELN